MQLSHYDLQVIGGKEKNKKPEKEISQWNLV